MSIHAKVQGFCIPNRVVKQQFGFMRRTHGAPRGPSVVVSSRVDLNTDFLKGATQTERECLCSELGSTKANGVAGAICALVLGCQGIVSTFGICLCGSRKPWGGWK